jgi:hypothetical protein
MGQARVRLPDGRDVSIAGEHEDHYDPDFYIYNDVVVVDDAGVRIFGYPTEVFPPTDFHTATLVDSTLYLLGNLGYPEDRKIGTTQVLQLDTETWTIEPLDITGRPPGWIHGHSATISRDGRCLVVTGGKICSDERIIENIDDYSLCLATLFWEKLTQRNWQRWIVEREDGGANRLWQIRTEAWNREHGMDLRRRISETLPDFPDTTVDEAPEAISDAQITMVQTLYQSPFSGEPAIEDEETYGRYLLDVSGVKVRFDEDMFGVTVTVEGQLGDDATGRILDQLSMTLSRIESTGYRVVALD